MVFSTRQGSGVLGTQEQPLEAVTFEATIEHAQNSILSFIAKIRTRSGRSLAAVITSVARDAPPWEMVELEIRLG